MVAGEKARGMAGAKTLGERDFGGWLRSWRHERRLTQKDLAAELGYDVTYLVKIEGGARPPTRQFLTRLSHIAGQPAETLMHASAVDGGRSAIPSPPDTLVGRELDVDRVTSMLTGPARCVTLVGPPGIGKTRLALEVASRLDGRFLCGVLWISLLEIDDAAAAPGHIQRVIGVPDRTGADAADTVVTHLRSQHVLLALDNWEHVKGAAGFVSRLLREAPRLSVLVTSREPLGIVSEHLYPVAPLAVPDLDQECTLAGVHDSPAVQLFVSRALMCWPHFRLNEQNCAAVARTCARLDGIPLAIVLAAGLVRTSDPARLDLSLHRMDDEGVAPHDLPSHHSTLSDAIAWSWSLLDGEERRTLARLAVFAGGCTAEAAAAVCGTADAWRHLASLSRQSLLEVRPDALGGPRFELLATIRAFAHVRLEQGDDIAHARQAHLAYFSSFAQEKGKGLLGRDQLACADALGADFENLRTAFEWALADDPAAALELAAGLWRFLLLRELPVGAKWLRDALLASTAPTPCRAEALAAFGSLGWVLGRFDEAAEALEEALRLAEAHGLADVAALAWLNRGALADQLDDIDTAEDCMRTALGLYRRLGDRRGEASALAGQGWLCRRRGELDQAYELLIQAAALFREVGDGFNRAKVLSSVGHASEAAGHYAEAAEWMAACKQAQQELRDVRGLAITEAALGRIALRLGQTAEAGQRHLDALTVFERLGESRRAADSLIALAAVANTDGRHYRAARLLGAAEAELERLGASLAEEQALHDGTRAACQRRMGDSAFHRHLLFGRSLSLGDAVALANDGAGTTSGGGGAPSPASAGRSRYYST